ncbi:disulfide bond formation protein DsbD [Lentibacillus kimchii]|uniref:Disulfide bond formation protein DsbD n=1 Tax=Lentibacillus kimchii TaxID=1542911 RepID=A0ABW2UYW7_9BACI
MSQKLFNTAGWMFLIAIGVFWIIMGYSGLYSLLLALSYISFSISDGSIKKLGKLSFSQAALILFALVVSVAVAFGLIQLGNYIINDMLHLTGVIKTISLIIATILSLTPAMFLFGSIIYKVSNHLESHKS